jgi:acetyltransferase-like isoleucine patch superfamily enzyme
MNLGSRFFCEKELRKLKFFFLGKNVLIKKNVGFYFIENISIGNNTRIDDHVIIVASKKENPVRIGNHVHITANCVLSGSEGIELMDFCTLAPGVQIFSGSDDYSGKKMTNPTVDREYIGGKAGKVTFKKHVIIGANSIILPKVTINEGSSVGAMSLVNKSLDSWGVYAGVPVKKLKNRSKNILKIEKLFLSKKNFRIT